ncbi:xanthine dehydrogenase small subunit [Hylemonella gracilis]|uniref:Xanthine dehydrogenase small subunit n=1 Tax=Hylemonella gracilis TaxID=80880 RepID=A0A4P6UJ96_9BURK|nr:FAD binding domain-containing protein [Hylemonella gracilis]QBK04160.1 xanthine dehydrogenase small subunit [Hylemonella gracilis]
MKHPVLQFVHRGEIVRLSDVPPSRTLLEILREDLQCTAVKEGCGEGDCGACTVVLGTAEDGELRYRAINSCIRLAHSVQGQAVWTADDLTTGMVPVAAAAQPHADVRSQGESEAVPPPGHERPALHPCQQAMVDCHGSQCGFCTPGFVMSLFGMYQGKVLNGEAVDRAMAQADLSGNLCRCTGYRPILDAAQHMADLPRVQVDKAAVLRQLRSLEPGSDPDYLTPTTLAELLAARAAHPQAQIVAGTTDVGLWVTKQHRQFEQVLDVTRAAELRHIERYPQHIAIGAAVPLQDAYAALVADRPQLRTFAERFAGLPVRNSGTLGGNIANGSPIGDSMPLLIALGASLVLMAARKGRLVSRELPLENFYTGYRKNQLAADELLAWIKVPLPTADATSAGPGRPKQASAPGTSEAQGSAALGGSEDTSVPSVGAEYFRVYKISKRQDDDISAVCLALNLQVQDGRITQARIGAGGVAATPARAYQTEASLEGQAWARTSLEQAAIVLAQEFAPISDMRASGDYRRGLLAQLPLRYWEEFEGNEPVRLEDLS